MSSEVNEIVTFSDSSDDVGVLADFAKRRPSLSVESKKVGSSGNDDDSEPDWVRDYTPNKENDADQKQAFLASLDDDDDDSVIDLISQDPEQKAEPKEEHEENGKGNGEEARPANSAAKRARVPTRPKSKLPLVVAPKLDESLVLLQSVDSDLDLSGDVGAVGRVKIQDGEMFLDIKGVIYRTSMYPCNTMCIVNVGDDEARITAVMDEAVTLTCERNLFASDEVVVRGEVDDDMDEDSQVDGRESEISKPNGKKSKDGSAKAARVNSNSKTKAGQLSKTISKPSSRKR